jgi:pyridinium-3,5-bisthiocarboxylic acid mononucleotide nickel chelatase
MKTAYFDCFSGISGDMILGAFLDLGLPVKLLKDTLKSLPLPELRLVIKREERQGLTGTTLKVQGKAREGVVRTFASIRQLLEKSPLDKTVRENSLAILKRLAQAEGTIHGVPLESVHFHEIGALDTIADIVGAALAFDYFKIHEVLSAPLPVGRGWIKSGHGPLPLPAPATLSLLKGAALIPSGNELELVTPTGAAILTHYATAYGPPPAMLLKEVGYGLGQLLVPDRPNALRIWLGEKSSEGKREPLVVLETNIDDMNPQWYDSVMDHLLEAGALDCLLIPCQMKKNRPAVLIQVLSKPENRDRLQDILLSETTTLGVRSYAVDRLCLERRIESLKTPWGPVRIKQAMRPENDHHHSGDFSIEYEDLKRLAGHGQGSIKEWDTRIRSWLNKQQKHS